LIFNLLAANTALRNNITQCMRETYLCRQLY